MSDILVKIGADISDFSRKMAESNRSLTNFSKANQQTFDSFKQVGAGVTAFGVAAAAGLGSAVKIAANFEAEMSKVGAISGATGDELAILSEKAREMGSKTKFSASESAQAFQYMAMAGWKTADMLDGIEGIMNLAAASGEDLALTSDIVTDALTAFGMKAADSGRFADILAAASSNANTNVAMLGESFKYVAPVAGALGMSAEDVSVALGLMANSGIKASSAGTALRTMLTNLSSPTKQMKETMDKLGLSLTDSKGNMKSLDQVMLDMRKSFSGLSESQQASAAATIFGKEAMSGALAIINASEADYNKLSEAINNSEGAAKQMADSMQDNLMGALTNLNSAFEEIMISLGTALLPAIELLVSGLQTLANWFNGLSDSTKSFIAISAAVAAGLALFIGPILMLIGFFPLLVSGFGSIATVLGITTAALLKGILIFTGIGAAIVGIGVALVIAYQKIEWFRETVNLVWEFIKESFSNALAFIKALVTGDFEGMVDAALNQMENMSKFLDEIWKIIKEIYNSALKWLAEKTGVDFETMKDTVDSVLTTTWEIIKRIWDWIKESFKNALDFVSALLEGDFEGMHKAVKNQMENIDGTVKDIWSKVEKFFKDIDLKEVGKNIIEGLIKGIGSMKDSLKKKAQEMAGTVVKAMAKRLDTHSPSKVTEEIGLWTGEGLVIGLGKMTNSVRKAGAHLAEAAVPDTPTISLAYDTPSGIRSSLSSAVSGTVDVNARDDMIAAAIYRLERKLTDLRVIMDSREVGRMVAPVVDREIEFKRRRFD